MAGQQDSQTSSRYSFWAGKPSGTKISSPRVIKSKFSYFVGNEKQNEWKIAQTEKEEITNKNPRHTGVCERAWEPFTDTVPGLVARQKTKAGGLAEETHFISSHEQGHISVQSVSPQQFQTVSFQRSCLALMYSYILAPKPLQIPSHAHCRKRKGSCV